MDISIIVTCYNERENIRECINSLLLQEYQGGKYEIIVSDGGSTDGTREVLLQLSATSPDIRLVVETKRGTAAGRNTGIKAARYDHIAFIDADCEAPADWLSRLMKAYRDARLKDPRVVAVGGTNIPPENADPFLLAIGVALDSFLGSLNSAQGKRFTESVYVSSLANLNVLYHKKSIIEAGFYDESLLSEAEDADINFRLFSAGYRFLFVPGSFVWHKMRPTPIAWFKNMFRYGKGRARLLKRYPRMWRFSYLLPLLFALSISSILLGPWIKPLFLPALYFPLLCVFSIFQSYMKRHPGLALHVMLVYLIQHLGYAAGELYGLLHPQVR